jgi:hypothetical protein
MSRTEEIRQCALALPEVEETRHFRFGSPVFKVRGRTFLGLGQDETTAVFCVSEERADQEAAADPGACAPVRRNDARKSFLGLEVALAGLAAGRIRYLVEEAWRQQAPAKLAAATAPAPPEATA